MSAKDFPNGQQLISRREFLHLGSLGVMAVLGISLPSRSFLHDLLNRFNLHLLQQSEISSDAQQIELLSPDQQGRVIDASIDVYDVPAFDGTRMNTHWHDQILSIQAITIGKSIDSFNMVWYKVSGEGYVHSGGIQPVFTHTNMPLTSIPQGGAVAEVTVPFTDARWDPGMDKPVAYRFYYATTYWVVELIQDEQGNPWYGVKDDKWEYIFYVPASHLRFIPRSEMAPISSQVPAEKKHIEVYLPQQVLIAYEYDQPVFMARVATGAKFSNGDYSTPAGYYTTFHKRYSRHMARGNLAANGYDLPGVPWNSYITEEGIAFHGTYWHNNFGRPRSHGCINLTPQAARWIYLWTMPVVPPDQEAVYEKTGTGVEIID